MSEMTIKTNGRPRDLVSYVELPGNAAEDFGYLESGEIYSPRFVQYRGNWYDTGDMMRAGNEFPGWDGCSGESYFSGVLLRFVDDGNRVVMARYYC